MGRGRNGTGYLLAMLAGLCVGAVGLGCSDRLDHVTAVDRFRVLGVSAEPPEVRPEHQGPIEMRVLWHDPHGGGRPVEFAWVFCYEDIPAATGLEYCEPVEAALLPPKQATADEGGDSYLLPGVSPLVFDYIEAGESLPVTAIILMCAGGTLPAVETLVETSEGEDLSALCAGGDGLHAYKTVVLANGNPYGDAPNTSPTIASLSLQGAALTPVGDEEPGAHEPDVFSCAAEGGCDRKWELAARFTEDSYQEYTSESFDTPEVETESPYIAWFATGGEMWTDVSISEGPADHPLMDWWPNAPGEYRLWAVAHDRRGGVSWQELVLRIVD